MHGDISRLHYYVKDRRGLLYKTTARVRGKVGSLIRYLICREIGPKVSDSKKPGWRDNQGRDNQGRDNQGRDNQVPLYMCVCVRVYVCVWRYAFLSFYNL